MAETSTHAVRPRQRVMSCLQAMGEVRDSSGMAATVLADAVGYQGSSAAFAQLLSGMEGAGLIEREIRGKRTYRIRLTGTGAAAASDAEPTADHGPSERTASAPLVATRNGAGGGELSAAAFDYDELARRLLAEVVRRLADGTGPESAQARPSGTATTTDPARTADLATTVTSLERKLAAGQAAQQKLIAENARLREHLSAAEQSLAQAQEQASSRRGRLDPAEMQVLERLLSSLQAQPGDQGNADVG